MDLETLIRNNKVFAPLKQCPHSTSPSAALSGLRDRDLALPFAAGARPPAFFGGGRVKTKSTVMV